MISFLVKTKDSFTVGCGEEEEKILRLRNAGKMLLTSSTAFLIYPDVTKVGKYRCAKQLNVKSIV